MPLMLHEGGILQVDGALAASENCCCDDSPDPDPSLCPNCSESVEDLGDADVTFAGFSGNPGSLIDCSAVCVLFNGTYALSGPTLFAGMCRWSFVTFARRIHLDVLKSGADYILRCSFGMLGCLGISECIYVFERNLGPVKPDCLSLTGSIPFVNTIGGEASCGPAGNKNCIPGTCTLNAINPP